MPKSKHKTDQTPSLLKNTNTLFHPLKTKEEGDHWRRRAKNLSILWVYWNHLGISEKDSSVVGQVEHISQRRKDPDYDHLCTNLKKLFFEHWLVSKGTASIVCPRGFVKLMFGHNLQGAMIEGDSKKVAWMLWEIPNWFPDWSMLMLIKLLMLRCFGIIGAWFVCFVWISSQN